MGIITYTFDRIRGQHIDDGEGWEEELAGIMFMKRRKVCWIRNFGDKKDEERMFELHLTIKEIT